MLCETERPRLAADLAQPRGPDGEVRRLAQSRKACFGASLRAERLATAPRPAGPGWLRRAQACFVALLASVCAVRSREEDSLERKLTKSLDDLIQEQEREKRERQQLLRQGRSTVTKSDPRQRTATGQRRGERPAQRRDDSPSRVGHGLRLPRNLLSRESMAGKRAQAH